MDRNGNHYKKVIVIDGYNATFHAVTVRVTKSVTIFFSQRCGATLRTDFSFESFR
jgi:hypothetical protein